MSTRLITDEDFNGEVLLNTYWGGLDKGMCSQLTISNDDNGYTQMTIDEMIDFFRTGLGKLLVKKGECYLK